MTLSPGTKLGFYKTLVETRAMGYMLGFGSAFGGDAAGSHFP